MASSLSKTAALLCAAECVFPRSRFKERRYIVISLGAGGNRGAGEALSQKFGAVAGTKTSFRGRRDDLERLNRECPSRGNAKDTERKLLISGAPSPLRSNQSPFLWGKSRRQEATPAVSRSREISGPAQKAFRPQFHGDPSRHFKVGIGPRHLGGGCTAVSVRTFAIA